MKYSINPEMWSTVFAVPSQVVDNHIKLAGASQLKSLLWAFRHSSEGLDIDKLSADIGLSRADAADALQYWVEHGIIIKDGEVAPVTFSPMPTVEVQPVVVKSEPVAERKILPALPVIKPSNEQIAARCKESADIREMFNEAQIKLGRTIGFDTQCALLMLTDQYGLPVAVIMMLLSYCADVNKTSNSYITAVGKNWAEKEIDSIEKADKMIDELKSCRKLWHELAEAAGISAPTPTTSQSEYLRTWTKDFGYGFDMIHLAYEEMADHTGSMSFAYMNKVLSNWHDSGFKTKDEALNAKNERAKARDGKKKEKKEASYNLDEYKRNALEEPLVYKKKE